MAGSPPIREQITIPGSGKLTPVWERYFILTLNEKIDKLLEEIRTRFDDGSIPFVESERLVEDNDNFSWDNINKILSVFDLIIQNLSASRMIYTDADKVLTSISDLSVWIKQTLKQVLVTDNGDGTITLSTPQNIDTDADVEFDSATLDDLTASRLTASDANKKVVSVTDLTDWLSGTTDETTVTDDGDGTATIGLVHPVLLREPVTDWYDPTAGLPVGPAVGDRYISEATANGWTEDYIYEWDGTSWVESEPEEGWMVWMLLEFMLYFFFSGGWVEADKRVCVDSDAEPGYLGAANSDGVLRTSYPLVYTDGGDFITLSLDALTTLISGTANEIEISDDGDETITIGIVTSPTLDGTNFTGIPDSALDEDYVNVDGTVPMTANWDTGGYLLSNLRLSLKAGSSGAGTTALKLAPGVALTTPEAGAIEFHNDRFYLTNVACRRVISRSNDIIIATTTIENTTTETVVYTASVPANSLKVANFLCLQLCGDITNASAADDITLRLKIGSTTLETFNPAVGNVTNANWCVKACLTVRTIGATGTISFHGEICIDNDDECLSTESIVVDTTSAEDITLTVEWDNAKAGNIFNIFQGITEWKG